VQNDQRVAPHGNDLVGVFFLFILPQPQLGFVRRNNTRNSCHGKRGDLLTDDLDHSLGDGGEAVGAQRAVGWGHVCVLNVR
jgi:hypothetical protein